MEHDAEVGDGQRLGFEIPAFTSNGHSLRDVVPGLVGSTAELGDQPEDAQRPTDLGLEATRPRQVQRTSGIGSCPVDVAFTRPPPAEAVQDADEHDTAGELGER